MAISDQATAEMKNSRGLGKKDRNMGQRFRERTVQLAVGAYVSCPVVKAAQG